MKHVSTVAIKKRIVTVFIFGLLLLLIIIFRLGYVQFVIGEELTGKAVDSWSRDITFNAERGHILDVKGDVLAENVTAPSVILVPRQIKEPQVTAEKLAEILEIPVKKAYEYVTQNKSSVAIHSEEIGRASCRERVSITEKGR